MKTKSIRTLAHLLKAAALSLAFAPVVSAAVTLDFSGNAADPDNVALKAAITAYSSTPTAGNYAAILAAVSTAVTSNQLPLTTISSPDFLATSQELYQRAGALHLQGSTTFTVSGFSVSPYPFLFRETIGVFSADSASSYLFTGNSAGNGTRRTVNIIAGSAVSLTNVVFANNVGGGGISNDGSIVTITGDTEFSGNTINTTSSYGGAIYTRGDNSRVTIAGNATFTDNAAATGGGAIMINGANANLTISGDAAFSGNHTVSSGYGGSIYNVDASITIGGNATFTDSRAGAYGGAIMNNGHLEILGTAEFSRNVVTTYGGGSIYNSGVIEIAGDVEFSENEVEAYSAKGGAIGNTSGGKITFSQDASFTRNHLSWDGLGGAIFNSRQNSEITIVGNATFIENDASYGGAIHNGSENTSGANTNITIWGNAEFSRNFVSSGVGGAIFNEGSNNSITISGYAEFSQNYNLSGSGGAIYNSGNLSFAAAAFSGNHTHADIYTAAYSGGAIYNPGGTITFSDLATFDNNEALDGHGGAIANDSGGSLSFAAAVFDNNHAGALGGAISSHGGTVSFSGLASFSENTAATGGAIYQYGTGSVTLSDRAVFINNSANTSGGAVHNSIGTFAFTDAIFDGNSANLGGAIYNTGGGIIDLNVSAGRQSIFHGNTARNAFGGDSVYLETSGNNSVLNINTASNGTLYMFDPMGGGGGAYQSQINKAGQGTWKLAGASVFSNAVVTVHAGTVHLYGTAEALEQITVTGAQLLINGTRSDYALSLTPNAGKLNVGSGTLNIKSAARLVLGGVGSEIKTASSGSVVIAANAELVFKVTSASGQTGMIATNNLAIGGAKLILDLDSAFLAVADVGTTLALFYDSAGSILQHPNGALLNGGFSSIQDTAGRFEWEMLPDGRVSILRRGPGAGPSTPAIVYPEPGTYALAGGLVALGFALWRRRRKAPGA